MEEAPDTDVEHEGTGPGDLDNLPDEDFESFATDEVIEEDETE